MARPPLLPPRSSAPLLHPSPSPPARPLPPRLGCGFVCALLESGARAKQKQEPAGPPEFAEPEEERAALRPPGGGLGLGLAHPSAAVRPGGGGGKFASPAPCLARFLPTRACLQRD